MDTQAIKQQLDAIEQAADKVVAAVKKSQAGAQLQGAADNFHQLARTKRALDDKDALQQGAMEVEKSADQLMAACRDAGQADADLKQAVEEAHQKASSLKHQLQQG